MQVSYFIWGPLVTLKLFLIYLINYPLMKKLNCSDLFLLSPLYEVFNLVFQGSLFIFSINNNHNRW